MSTLPDVFFETAREVYNAGELIGDTLAPNVIHSSLQDLGVQSADLDMGGYNIINANNITCDGFVCTGNVTGDTFTAVGGVALTGGVLDMGSRNIVNANTITATGDIFGNQLHAANGLTLTGGAIEMAAGSVNNATDVRAQNLYGNGLDSSGNSSITVSKDLALTGRYLLFPTVKESYALMDLGYDSGSPFVLTSKTDTIYMLTDGLGPPSGPGFWISLAVSSDWVDTSLTFYMVSSTAGFNWDLTKSVNIRFSDTGNWFIGKIKNTAGQQTVALGAASFCELDQDGNNNTMKMQFKIGQLLGLQVNEVYAMAFN